MDTTNADLTFNVAQLLKEAVGSTRKLEISTPRLTLSEEEVGDRDGTLQAHDLTGNIKITRLAHDLLVQGKASANVQLECSRCLDSFSIPVEGTLEEEYQPTVDIETGRPVQRAEYEQNDSAFSISASHEVDLTEPVRQALLVALPLKPLCREDCAGLCAECGANLNEGAHSHEPDSADSRWAALRELKLEDLPAGDENVN
jgi:uncharacterized protein